MRGSRAFDQSEMRTSLADGLLHVLVAAMLDCLSEDHWALILPVFWSFDFSFSQGYFSTPKLTKLVFMYSHMVARYFCHFKKLYQLYKRFSFHFIAFLFIYGFSEVIILYIYINNYSFIKNE